MSDRRNRDVGRKRTHQTNRTYCGCWHCITGKEKKRILTAKDFKRVQDQFKDHDIPAAIRKINENYNL